MQEILGQVSGGQDLTMDAMSGVMDRIMNGECAENEIALLLTALHEKGETQAEVAGAALAMRKHMTPIRSNRSPLVDTCGTGGDGSSTFNISTAAAVVTAASGVSVAKHGNRKITSKTGSADVLTELGVNVEASVETVEKCLDRLGICFCFAPSLHSAMRHVAPVRRSLGFPTIFNMLGPLTNPASAQFQVLGVARPELRPMLAGALALLQVDRAVVVHGADGLDEVTLNAATHVSLVEDGEVSELQWFPSDFDIVAAPLESMTVETPAASADRIRAVFDGEKSPSRDIVLLNSAAAIWTSRAAQTLTEAAEKAAEAVDSGGAAKLLDELGRLSHE